MYHPSLYLILNYKQGCGVGVGVWSRSRWSRMFSAGVGVGSRNRFFKTTGVGVRSRSRNICCYYRLQCLLNNLNYNINCLKIITGYWQY